MTEERLQKILSQAGVASRRQAEKLMTEGRVTVNGTVVTELGSKADIERDHIKVDGRLIHAPKRQIYVALSKPNNTVTVNSQSDGDRPRASDSIRPCWRGGRVRFRNQQSAGYGDAGPLQKITPGQTFLPCPGLFWLLLFPFHALLLRFLNETR